jgi:signal transduction histidine kinase
MVIAPMLFVSIAVLWGAARVNRGNADVKRELARREQAEHELRALTTELEQRVAHRTAELGVANRELESFSYSVSHDLRTPLRALDGFSQALLEDYGERLDETGRDYLRRIRRGSQRMGDLIDALLDLSRVSRGELRRELVDLTSIATDIVESLRARAPDRAVNVHVQPGLKTTGDARLLRALLQNLFTNAWKFTGRRADARIEFAHHTDNGQAHFVVRDNGVGFDMTYAPKLFGAFQRLHSDRDFEGTGVGLATAQRIVHRHGGTIWVEAAPDAGAAFFFTLS